MNKKGIEALKGIKTEKQESKLENQELKTIVIGIPHTGLFHWQTMASLLSMQFVKGYQLKYHMIGSCLVYEAREAIAKFAMESNADYIVYLDSDMVPPTDMLIKMINTFEQMPDTGLVSGMAFKRIPPFQPCFYTKLAYDTKNLKPLLESPIKFPTEGLIELQGVGMACCMLKTDVFRKINAPYFFPLPNVGEDLTFCLKMKHAGIKMYCDLSIDVGHVSTIPIYKQNFEECRDEHEKANNGEPLFKEG